MRAEGQALYHLLFKASLDGLVVRGPMAGSKQAYVLVKDWLGEPKPVDRDDALPEFARRYLAGHGPATERDLARWAGIPLRDVRAGLSAIASELEELGDGLVDLKKRRARRRTATGRACSAPSSPRCSAGPRARTSSAEPPTSSRWAGCSTPSRWSAGGRSRVGSDADGRLELEPFRRIAKADRAALERDAEDVERFLG